jgi:hypothetical protein
MEGHHRGRREDRYYSGLFHTLPVNQVFVNPLGFNTLIHI